MLAGFQRHFTLFLLRFTASWPGSHAPGSRRGRDIPPPPRFDLCRTSRCSPGSAKLLSDARPPEQRLNGPWDTEVNRLLSCCRCESLPFRSELESELQSDVASSLQPWNKQQQQKPRYSKLEIRVFIKNILSRSSEFTSYVRKEVKKVSAAAAA